MERKTLRLVRLTLAFFLCAAFCRNAAAQTPQKTATQALALGIVSDSNRNSVAERFSDYAHYVAAQLGVEESKVIVAGSAFDLARMIEQRQVDFYLESPYPTYFINDVQGVAKLLLRRWKRGKAEYRSLIFTRKSGEIARLEDLRGKVLLFEDPESTSGHFLPRAFLTRRGFTFTDKSRFDPDVSPSDIGYLFAYSQENLVDRVLTKKAAAGAFSDDDYARLDKKTQGQIAVLAQTETVPRHLVSVRNTLPPALADRLANVLRSMSENEAGRRILRKTDDTTKFDVLPEGEAGLRRKFAEIFRPAKKN